MAVVQKLYTLSKELYELLGTLPSEQDREDYIAKIDVYLESRAGLIKDLKPPFTKEELILGNEINKLNLEFDKQMVKLRQQIQIDIANLKQKKKTTQQYVNPYQSLITGGAFYDKRN